MPGRQLGDVAKNRGRGEGRPEGKNLTQSVDVDLAVDLRIDEERLDFGGEKEPVRRLRVEQRTNT